MKTLKELATYYGNAWVYCRNEELQIRFLTQLEEEGFSALNGQKPTELFHHTRYGINDDLTMGYLSGMIWCLSAQNPNDNHIRIDYEKYLADKEDIFYHMSEKEKEYELVPVSNEEALEMMRKARKEKAKAGVENDKKREQG